MSSRRDHRRRRIATAVVVALAAAVQAPVAAAECRLTDHRVNAYTTTVAADVVRDLNERRAALGRAPLAIHPQLWLKAMWRAGRTAASGTILVGGPDPCPGAGGPPEVNGRSFSRPEAPGAILDHPAIVETGRLDALLAPSTRSVGLGIAYAFFHTTWVLYASDEEAPPTGNEAPRVAGESVPLTPSHPPHDLAPALLANDTDDQGLVHVVEAHAAHGTVTYGWAGLRGLSVFYTPDPGFTGADTLTYTVADAFGVTSSGDATLTVGRPATRARLRLRIGAGGDRVALERLREVAVIVTVTRPGAVTLMVTRDGRTIGSLRRRVGATGASVPLRWLFPARAQPGRYTLIGVYAGTTTRLHFRLV